MTRKGDASASTRRGFSIRVFVADGLPDGLWVVDKPNWTGVALAWPRTAYPRVRHREELDRAGVYVLLGPSDTARESQRVYIGEADVLRKRLDTQYANRDFWTRAVAFASKDVSLNKAHVRYVESRLIGLAHKNPRAQVDNGTAPPVPFLSEAEQADLETFLDEMLLIYPVLDVRVFETLADSSYAGTRLYAQGPGPANAEGQETSDGFVVFAGSRARAEVVESVPGHAAELRNELLASGVLVSEDGGLRFTEDYLFNSPSTAASVVFGNSSNGRIAWKDVSGRTLREIQTAEVGGGEMDGE
jgi:Domain of unknown function (DUF4357)